MAKRFQTHAGPLDPSKRSQSAAAKMGKRDLFDADEEDDFDGAGSGSEALDEENEEDPESESDSNGDDESERQAMLAALEAHGRAFLGGVNTTTSSEAGPSKPRKVVKRQKIDTEDLSPSIGIAAEEKSRKRRKIVGMKVKKGKKGGFDEDDGWNGIESEAGKRTSQLTAEQQDQGTIVQTVVFGGNTDKIKAESSKADRKKFMSAKSSKMLQDEDFGVSNGKKRKLVPDDADDEDRSNAALDKTLQNMLMTNLLAGAGNATRPVEKRNALKGRLLELADDTALGLGSTTAASSAYDSQPLRIRSGIRRAQSARSASEISNARASGSYSNKIGGLADGAGAGRARLLANKVLQGKKEEGRERDRGIGMGIGKFKGGMLTLSKREVHLGSGAGERSGGNRKKGKGKGKGKGRK